MNTTQRNRLQIDDNYYNNKNFESIKNDNYNNLNEKVESNYNIYKKNRSKKFRYFIIFLIILFIVTFLGIGGYLLNKKYNIILFQDKLNSTTNIFSNEKKELPEYHYYIPQNITNEDINKAKIHFNAKEYEQAISLLEHVVNSNNTDEVKAQALIYLGIIALDRDNFELARGKFMQTLKYNPKSIASFVNLAILEKKLNNLNAAREYILQARKLAPDDNQVNLLLGNILFENQNPDDAISTYQRAFNGLAEDAYVYYNLGLSYLKKKNYETALENFKNALDKTLDISLKIKANAQISLIYLQKENYSLAADYMLNAVKFAPNNAKYLYNLGVIYLYKKEPVSAINYFKNALNAGETNPQIYRNLAQAFINVNEKDLAKIALEKALELNTKDFAALLLLGDLQYKTGNLENAVQSFRKLVQNTPGDENTVVALLKLAQVYADMENYKAAVESLSRAIVYQPNNVKVYLLLGKIYKKINRHDLAIETWKKALSSSGGVDEANKLELKDERELRLILAEEFRNQGAFDSAIKQYQKIEARNLEYSQSFEDAKLLISWALTYMAAQDYKLAIPLLKKASNIYTATNDERKTALANLANCYSKDENIESFSLALNAIQRALNINSNDPNLILIQADILLKTKNSINREKAIENLLALSKSLNDSNILKKNYNLLGQAYTQNGEYKRAISAFDYALQLDPSYKEAYLNQKNATKLYELNK